MPYGEDGYISYRKVLTPPIYSVRLGNSGLKVSRIILGTMQYGNKGWQEWVLGEDEAVEHIKTAFVVIFNNMSMVCPNHRNSYEAGIQTFDTADVTHSILLLSPG